VPLLGLAGPERVRSLHPGERPIVGESRRSLTSDAELPELVRSGRCQIGAGSVATICTTVTPTSRADTVQSGLSIPCARTTV
jgi:hypothetical protein